MLENPLIDLVGLFQKIQEDRREHILLTDHGEFIYSPANKTYSRVTQVFPPARTRSVSNAEALLLVVIEEAKRRENTTGNFMTVIFNQLGGTFCTDDKNRDNMDTWDFSRKISKQFEVLKSVIDKTFDHTDLLRAMSLLRYSVVNFHEVYNAMRQVRVDKKAMIQSQPRLKNGQAGSEIAFSFQIEGETDGVQKALFPAEFVVDMPLVSMSSKNYQIQIEVEAWVDDKSLKFALRASGVSSVFTNAVLEEISKFTADAKKALPDLLIVTDL